MAVSTLVSSSSNPDGWTSAGETWTYATAATFTVAGDLTTKYSKGDKIKLTQSATVKYFYITGVSHGAGTTTITVAGGTDYTLANAAISSPYFSKEETPNAFPTSFAFTLGFTGFSANPASISAKFSITGNICHLTIRSAVTGTSNSTGFTLTGLPVAAANTIASIGPAQVQNNGTIAVGYIVIDPNETFIYVCINTGGSSWTNSGNKACHIAAISYPF